MTARQLAQTAGDKHYHGRPCKRCQNTERDVAGRHCLECECTRQRRLYDDLTGLEYNRLLLRRRRVKALRRIAARQEAQHRPLQK